MTRIAVISGFALETPPVGYGGLEWVAYLNAEYLAERGYDVTLIASRGSRAPPRCRLMETVEPSFFGAEARAWRVYGDRLDGFDYVIDHSHSFHAFRAKIRNPELKVLKVVHDLAPWLSPPPRNSYDVMAGVSMWHAEHLSNLYGIECEYLHHGLPIGDFPFKAKKEGYLLFLSRISPGKGAHVFIDICGELGADGIMAGDDDVMHGIDPWYRDYVMRRAQEEGIEYLGRVSHEEKLELLKNAEALVLPLQPPYYEVFGLVIVEAQACGTPVFVTDRGAPRELVRQGRTGFVLKDKEEIVGKLRAYMDGEITISPRECREWVESKFGMENYGKYLKVLGVR